MKTNFKEEKSIDTPMMWYMWDEFCDKCGKKIHGHEIRHSRKPNVEEHDYCYECLIFLFDKDFKYKEAGEG